MFEEGAGGREPGRLPEHGLQRGGRPGRDQGRAGRPGVDGHGRPRRRRLGARATRSTSPSRDQADAVVCLAADALTDTVIEAYDELGVLARRSRARTAHGFALAEAGVALLARAARRRRRRAARASTARCSATAITSDAQGVGDDRPRGRRASSGRCALALERAGVSPERRHGRVGERAAGHRYADAAEATGDRARASASDVDRASRRSCKLGEPMGAGGVAQRGARAEGLARRRRARGPGARQQPLARRHELLDRAGPGHVSKYSREGRFAATAAEGPGSGGPAPSMRSTRSRPRCARRTQTEHCRA